MEREQKSPARAVKHEAKSPKKDVLLHGSGARDGKIQLEPLERRRRKNERSRKSLDAVDKSLDLDKDLYTVDTNMDGRGPKSVKTKRRRRTKTESPQKNLQAEEKTASDNTVVTYNKENTENAKENSTLQFQEPTPPVNENASKDSKIKKPQNFDVHGVTSEGYSEGDMVAIKVPEKLYIKGQPCLGKITTLGDHQGLLTVHYYTGSYQGRWRPMMSRTSPYLRKVAAADVLCKFKLSSDGRLSPITQGKLRTVIDDERSKSDDTK